MTNPPDTQPPPPEIFRIDPRAPFIIATAGVCMVLFGALADLEDGLDTAFAGVGLLLVLGSIPLAVHPFAVLNDDHLKVGKQVFHYRDIVAVLDGAFAKAATATLPRHTQPFLLIQTTQSAAPYLVRVAHVRGGVGGLRARLMLRVERVRDQERVHEAQVAPSSNTASN
jgi:hypothetical protein